MNRAQLLKRATGALLALQAGRLLELAPPAAASPTLVWPDGTLLLDSGTLELGIVRDSVLTSTHDFQIFGEVFERVAKVGTVEGQVVA